MSRLSNRKWKIGGLVIAVAALIGAAGAAPAHALALGSHPDVKVGSITVEFSSGTLSAWGSAEKYNLGPATGGAFVEYGSDLKPNFDLFAAIGTTGEIGSGSTFSIYDDLDSSTDFTPGDFLYLSGDLSGLQFSLMDPVLNFLFAPTGGEYLGDYGTLGGLILGGSGFDQSSLGFEGTFRSTTGVADVGTPVPEPATVWLLFGGAAGIAALRRRKG